LSDSPFGADGAGRSNEFFDRCFAGNAVMAITRGSPVAETVEFCELAWRSGIEVVEVTVHTASAVASFDAAAAAAARHGRQIGAGTVTTVEQVHHVRSNGAAFTVAPGFDVDVARASLEAGMAHLPGVATATEVQRAIACGFRWLKAFPASLLTPAWVKALLAPFPSACFVVTGGVDAHNAQEFLAAGAKAVGVGSALNTPGQLDLLRALRPGRD